MEGDDIGIIATGSLVVQCPSQRKDCKRRNLCPRCKYEYN